MKCIIRKRQTYASAMVKNLKILRRLDALAIFVANAILTQIRRFRIDDFYMGLISIRDVNGLKILRLFLREIGFILYRGSL